MSDLILGNATTSSINTNLAGSPVPANIGQLFIGNTVTSADAITIDSGGNFPPGIAFRRYLGAPSSPAIVTAGTQAGYCDYRFYSGGQFWNSASIDAIVDGATGFIAGNLPPARLRFATAKDNSGAKVAMEVSAQGALEIGTLTSSGSYVPGWISGYRLLVNTDTNTWAVLVTANAASGANYAARFHSLSETVNDYLIGGSSGAGSGSFKFSVRGNGVVDTTAYYSVSGTRVVAARQPSLPADATDLASAITLLNAIKQRLIAHGLVAP
jgi:hypothetical protein